MPRRGRRARAAGRSKALAISGPCVGRGLFLARPIVWSGLDCRCRTLLLTENAQAADLFAGGSAEVVAADLQRKGFDASVQQDRVVVHGATKAQVREALADRGPGDVEVVVKNP